MRYQGFFHPTYAARYARTFRLSLAFPLPCLTHRADQLSPDQKPYPVAPPCTPCSRCARELRSLSSCPPPADPDTPGTHPWRIFPDGHGKVAEGIGCVTVIVMERPTG